MLTQRRVWELMSTQCKFLGEDKTCIYYGTMLLLGRARDCKCETCPILGCVGVEVWETGSRP